MPRGALSAEGSVTTGEGITGLEGSRASGVDERAWVGVEASVDLCGSRATRCSRPGREGLRGVASSAAPTHEPSIARASLVACEALAAEDAERVDAARGADEDAAEVTRAFEVPARLELEDQARAMRPRSGPGALAPRVHDLCVDETALTVERPPRALGLPLRRGRAWGPRIFSAGAEPIRTYPQFPPPGRSSRGETGE